MRILLVRHGEPDYTVDSLTEKGWREAELLGQRLEKEHLDGLYVSPLGRAQDTAKPLLKRIERTAVTLPWLQEFRGRTYDAGTGEQRIPWNLPPQYWTAQPELYDRNAWRTNALFETGDVSAVYDETAAGLEALLAEWGYRRDGGIYRCKKNDEITLALFCHFGLGMVILSHLMNVSPTVMWQCFFMPTSSVTTLITEERVQGEVFFKCMQMGDTSHLFAGNEPVSHSGLYCETFGSGNVKEAQ